MSYKAGKSNPEYQRYHKQVVEACVRLIGERCRQFFDTQCDFLEEFNSEQDPEEVAQDQLESL